MELSIAELYIEHAASWSLVFCRVLGMFIFTPVLAGQSVPIRVRSLLAAMMAVAIYALLPDEQRHVGSVPLASYVMIVASEVFVGVSIGLVAGLPMIAVEIAGQVIGYQLGFAVAQASNPDLDINLDAIGTMLFFMTLSMFLMTGGLDATITAFLGTFGSLPAGGLAFGDAPLEAYVGVLTQGTELALRLAAPVAGVVLLSMMAMGFVMRTVPQFNVMSVGFAIGIMLGAGALMFALFATSDAVGDHITTAVRAVMMWLDRVGAAPAVLGDAIGSGAVSHG